jgi:predicted RecA/RadA family phage recombinase
MFLGLGHTITTVAPRDITAGQGLFLGSRFVVAAAPAARGTYLVVRTSGLYDFAVGRAVRAGECVYFDPAKGVNVDGVGTVIGIVTADRKDGGALVLLDAAATPVELPEVEVAEPAPAVVAEVAEPAPEETASASKSPQRRRKR